MKTIYLVRHAETEFNTGQPISSRSGVSLSAAGIKAAEQFAQHFPIIPKLLICSDTERACATLHPLHQHFPTAQMETWAVHEFNWMVLERFATLTEETLIPLAEAYWNRGDPQYSDGDGAESFAEYLNRLQRVRAQLNQTDATTIVLISHGMFIRAMLWYTLTGQPAPTPQAMESLHHFILGISIPNLGVVRVVIGKSGDWMFSPIMSTAFE
jgi:probable phosphoglycerate mutase